MLLDEIEHQGQHDKAESYIFLDLRKFVVPGFGLIAGHKRIHAGRAIAPDKPGSCGLERTTRLKNTQSSILYDCENNLQHENRSFTAILYGLCANARRKQNIEYHINTVFQVLFQRKCPNAPARKFLVLPWVPTTLFICGKHDDEAGFPLPDELGRSS